MGTRRKIFQIEKFHFGRKVHISLYVKTNDQFNVGTAVVIPEVIRIVVEANIEKGGMISIFSEENSIRESIRRKAKDARQILTWKTRTIGYFATILFFALRPVWGH